MTYVEKIKKRFTNDTFATKAAKIELISAEPENPEDEEGCEAVNVVCRMKIKDIHRNANGGVMGGAIFTLADYAFAVCANAINKKHVTVTASSTINFTGPCKGTELYAKPVCVKNGKNLCFYEIRVYDNLDNLVSSVLMTGMKQPVNNYF